MSRKPLRGKQRLFWRLTLEGRSRLAAAKELGLSLHTAQRWFRQGGGVAPPSVQARASGRYLSFGEREEIFAGVERGQSIRLIAKNLDREPSTVLRELRRNMRQQYRTRSRLEGRPGAHRTAPWDYRPSAAQRGADLRAARPKPALLAANKRLHDWVQAKLEERLSPEQISARLPVWFPKDAEMRVSPETIYQSIYVQGRGALRRELAVCLRTGRALRRPRRQSGERRGRIP